MLLHVGAFKLDIDSKQNTPWHAIAPRTRLLCALLFVFAVVLTPNGHWQTWAVYGIGLLSLILIARLTITELLKRLAVEFAFIGVVLYKERNTHDHAMLVVFYCQWCSNKQKFYIR